MGRRGPLVLRRAAVDTVDIQRQLHTVDIRTVDIRICREFVWSPARSALARLSLHFARIDVGGLKQEGGVMNMAAK